MTGISQGTVSANGVEFAYLSAGQPGNPLALCLHGFPDSAHGWRHQLPALAEAGYHAVAPFQRGYAPTSVPADGLYQTGALATDANALHEALGGGADAVILGHDWGASGTHGAVVLAPERWAKVVTMAVPPGPAMAMAFITNLAQVQRSWYMFFFQHGLADMVVPANDLANVKAALREPANLTAALGYYRATLGDGLKSPALDAAQAATQGWATQPHLYLHGRNDGCIGVEVAEAAAAMAPPNVTVEIVDDAGHFLHLEQPAIVTARILEFLA